MTDSLTILGKTYRLESHQPHHDAGDQGECSNSGQPQAHGNQTNCHSRCYESPGAKNMRSAKLERGVRGEIERDASEERIEPDPDERIAELMMLGVPYVLQELLHSQSHQHDSRHQREVQKAVGVPGEAGPGGVLLGGKCSL